MFLLRKKFFQIFVFFYFIFGSIASVNNGISFDENHEQLNWNYHVSFVKNLSNKIFFNQKYNENIEKLLLKGETRLKT